MNLDVIVVAYRSGPELRRCLGSVRAFAGESHAAVVVNNDPSDSSPMAVAEEFGARVITSDGNVGFCAAVNRALADTDAPYVLLLNPDAGLTVDFTSRLIGHLESDRSIAAAGGRIMRGGAESRFVDSLGIEMQRGRRAVDIGHGLPDTGDRLGVVERFGVTAAAAIYRRSALEDVAVGGEVLPGSFFMYLDDVDLAWRLRLAGYRSVVDDDAVAWHRRGAAGDTDGEAHGLQRVLQTMAREAERPDYVRERSWVNHLLMLVRNDDSSAFLNQFPYYAARRLPGDLFGLVQRPGMAIRMRQRFLELVPGALEERREIQARRVVSASDMARWLP